MNKDRLLSDGELRKKVDDYLTNSVILPKSNKDNITARLDGLLASLTPKSVYTQRVSLKQHFYTLTLVRMELASII